MTAAAWPQNYVTDAGTLIEDFTASSEFGTFTGGGANGGTIEESTLLTRFGGTQFHMTVPAHNPAGNANAYKTTYALNLSAFRNLIISVFVPNYVPANLQSMQTYLTSDPTTMTNYYQAGRNLFKQGWNDVPFTFANLTKTLAPDIAAITQIRYRVLGSTTLAKEVYSGAVYFNAVSRPKVILSFDDGYDDAYTEGFTFANALGLPLTHFIIPSVVGVAGRLSAANIDTMYGAGNGICGHYATEIDDLTQAEITEIMIGVREYLAANGWTEGQQFWAWPGGKYGSTVGTEAGFDKCYAAAAAAGYQAARGGASQQQCTALGLDNRWSTSGYQLDNTFNLAAAKTAVDTAISLGTTVMFFTHKLEAVAASDTWVISDWQALCTYIYERVKLGLIDSVTYPAWYRGLTQPVAPL